MALQSVLANLSIPDIPSSISGAAGHASLLLDAADEKVAFIFRAPKAGDITKVVFLTGAVTTGAIVDVRIETVSLTTGDPTGTLWGTTTNGAVVIANADDNVFKTATLTLAATVAKGDLLAVVIVNPSVLPGNLNVQSSSDHNSGYPYRDLFTTVWTKGNRPLIIGIEYSGGSYDVVQGTILASYTSTTYNNGSTPDERGLIFQLPFPCSVRGAWVWVDLDGDADIVLYDSDGTSVLTSVSLDTNVRESAIPDLFIVEFSTSINLSKTTNYRLSLKPTSVTDVVLQEFTVSTAAAMDSNSGGQNFHLTTRTDAGSWSQTTTQRPLMGLLLSSFDDAVSASGGGIRLAGHGGLAA